MRFFIAWALTAELFAQSPTNEPRRAAYPQLYALTELARSAPPEFAAYGLLRILDDATIPDPAWRLDLAKEALTLAASARHPIHRRLAPGISSTDSGAMLWHTAHQQSLDALSLSLRAIDHLRRLDPAAAKEAFAQLPRPTTATATCKDALLDDTSGWFITAARLKIDPLPLVQSLQSPTELAPAVELILQSARTVEQFDLLSGALGQALRVLPPNDRAFNAALFDAPNALAQLHSVLTAHGRPTAALADGWRAWMQAGMQSPACQESRDLGPQQQARQDAFDLFNKTLPPLDLEILKPAGEAVAANLEPFPGNDASRAQAILFRSLLFGDQDRGVSNKDKETPEWREKMQQFLQSIEKRTRAAGESDIEYFYGQCQLWSGVLMAAPAGPIRERALNQYVAFLLANAAHLDPLIWFSQVEWMAGITRSLHGDEFIKVLNALRLTAHPVLQLYAELESAYPTRPQPKVN